MSLVGALRRAKNGSWTIFFAIFDKIPRISPDLAFKKAILVVSISVALAFGFGFGHEVSFGASMGQSKKSNISDFIANISQTKNIE